MTFFVIVIFSFTIGLLTAIGADSLTLGGAVFIGLTIIITVLDSIDDRLKKLNENFSPEKKPECGCKKEKTDITV